MNKDEIQAWLTQLKKPVDPDGLWIIKLISTKVRTLNANRFYWALNARLVDVLDKPELELHVELLRKYGTTKVDEDGVPMVYKMPSEVPLEKIYKYVDIVEDFGQYRTWRILKGSSELSPSEMRIFLDGVIDECHEVGVRVDIKPKQYEDMIERWAQDYGE